MINILDFPLLVFALTFVAMWLSTWLGAAYRRRREKLEEAEHEDYGVVLAASLTLLGLIIGFSFSMATSRYDQRKNLEEEEANAIGTEYVRADLLPAADAAKVRPLLRSYLDQRILFYSIRDPDQVRKVNARTAQLQNELWAAVLPPAVAQPTQITALAVSGMNDVLNSQGYSQAAWWNRLPVAGWAMMGAIALCCSALFGYLERNVKRDRLLHVVLPFIVSLSFFLIADIDSPRWGVIHVRPQNLISLAESLRPQ